MMVCRPRSGNGRLRVALGAVSLVAMVVPVLAAAGSAAGAAPAAEPRGTAHGYVLVAADGDAYAFGDARLFGENQNLGPDIVGMAGTADGGGYWMVDEDGDIFAYGNGANHGSRADNSRNVVGLAARPHGDGYWMVGNDGGVFSFGAAPFFGSTGAIRLNQPIVGMAATPTGRGYWLVATDGGIFAFGDAVFWGSTGDMALNKPIVGMAPTPTGRGYWLVATDGGIFAFGDAVFWGSTGAMRLNKPIVGMASTGSGDGYWLVASDGGIFTFGDARFLGSTGDRTLLNPIIGMFAIPDKVPVAVDDAFTVPEDGSHTASVLANDTGLGDGGIVVTVAGGPSHGTATATADGRITYTPARDYAGADAFTYRIVDADGDVSVAAVRVTVMGHNDRPSAGGNPTLTVNEDETVTAKVNGSDPDGDALVYTISGNPAHGVAQLLDASGTVRYTPGPDWSGSDSFAVTVDDRKGGTDTSVFSVTVVPVNDRPLAVNDTATTPEDTAALVNVLANDTGLGDGGIGVTVIAGPSHGTVTPPSADGSITYTPAADYFGADTFTYRVTDAGGDDDPDTPTATVSIIVTGVNDAPSAGADQVLVTAEDVAGTATVTASDPDGDALTYRVSVAALHGTATIDADTGAVMYTPDPDWHGTDGFTVLVDDQNSGTDTMVFAVAVNSVNDAPTMGAVPTQTVTALMTTVAPVLLPAGDVEDDVTALTVGAVSLDSAILGNESVSVYLDAGQWYLAISTRPLSGTVTVRITVTDSAGGTMGGDVVFIFEEASVQ